MIEECVYGFSPSMVATGIIQDGICQNMSYTYCHGQALNDLAQKDVTIVDIYRAINNLNDLLKQYFSMNIENRLSLD
jgi:hypothetical protein